MTSNIIKICGITCIEDGEMVISAGANTLGINIWSASPRSVSVSAAAAIASALRGRIDIVLVTVNMAWDDLLEACALISPDWVQLHGDEPDAWVKRLQRDAGVRAYRAIGLGDTDDVQQALAASGDRVLIDARDDVQRGGTGRSPARVLAQQVCAQRPTLLAGGLGPDNVEDAILACKPLGVDAASRVEVSVATDATSLRGVPSQGPALRRKDPDKVLDFVRAAKRGFAQRTSH